MSDYAVIDIETTGSAPWRDELVCVGIGAKVYPRKEGTGFARMLMARPGTTIVAHTNYDLRWLMLDGASLAEGVEYHDTRVMAWMLDGNQALDLESLAEKYLDVTPPKLIRMRGGVVCFLCRDGEIRPITEARWEEVASYCNSDCLTEGSLYEVLRGQLQERGLWEHFTTEEAPFSRILVEMEVCGLPFDKERAAALLETTELRVETLLEGLVERTGAPGFNPNSGDQVASFLYGETWTHPIKFAIPRLVKISKEEKLEIAQRLAPRGAIVTRVGRDYAYGEMELDGMALRPPKKKRSWPRPDDEKESAKRPSVSSKILNVLHGGKPWVRDYIEFKKAGKLAGYLRDWLEREHNGRLHGRFDQAGTGTGRLSGKEPNLQQIDRSVRDLFVGDLVIGDYGGLEARLAASASLDPVMLDIFRNGKDLYGTLAARAWGGPESKENEGRGLFKVLWLASQYGAQGETLATTMAVAGMRGYTASKADALLKDLEATCPRLFEWRNEIIEEAKYLGYITTIGGRRRELPNINSSVWKLMAGGERQAVNSTIQGSAADVVRRAMVALRRAFAPDELQLCLQVHDEILALRGPNYKPWMFEEFVRICETAHGFDLEVPLIFEAAVAQSWADKGGSGGQVGAGEYAALSDALEAASA